MTSKDNLVEILTGSFLQKSGIAFERVQFIIISMVAKKFIRQVFIRQVFIGPQDKLKHKI